MKIKELINEIEMDDLGYRIPRAKREDDTTHCYECGSEKELQPCGIKEINDLLCATCRRRFGYKWCDKCNINHIGGMCPESAYTKE